MKKKDYFYFSFYSERTARKKIRPLRSIEQKIEHSLLRIEFVNEITEKFEEETKFEDIDAENDRK